MKYIAIILLVAVGVYLYKRAQRLAQEEQQEAQQPVEKIVSSEEVTPSTPVGDDVAKPKDEALEFESAVAVEVVSEEVKAAAEPEPEPEPEPAYKMVAVTDESWANEKLAKALAEYRTVPSVEDKHLALLQAVAECYKQRKQEKYRDYGAALSPYYQSLFAALPTPSGEKGVGFMQLATLLNDSGDFDSALEVCQAAISYGLTDGTVTGFEGRITRIEKAKAKAQK